MDYYTKGKDIVLKQSDFDLDQTLDCGQAFRWVKGDGDRYTGSFLNHYLDIRCEDKNDGVFVLENVSEKDFLDVWFDYFDLSTDYGEIKRQLSEDETLAKACEFAGGIRILKQDPWEALTSFIISQNNNIKRIKGIIARMCSYYGEYPTAQMLIKETPESLSFLRAGFRAKYLIDAAIRVDLGEVDLKQAAASSLDEARECLMKIKGVGPKVADCTLLFGMYKLEAFPRDVWVKRVMERWYPNGLPDCTKGAQGVAQQYLFHYIRTFDDNKA